MDEKEYTAVLMQGSGSFGVESVLSSVVPEDGAVLLLSNGAYGERAAKMCGYHKIPCTHVTPGIQPDPGSWKDGGGP